MVFRSYEKKRVMYWKEVRLESMEEYRSGVCYLQSQVWIIRTIVCDGRKWFFSAFWNIPVQMCQFYQIQIVTWYLTRHPKTDAWKALRTLVLLLTKTDKESFSYWLDQWHEQHVDFMNEYSINPETNRRQYMHKRPRSAYRSMRNHLPCQWTCIITFERWISPTPLIHSMDHSLISRKRSPFTEA
jgi:hypothetical protein